MSWRPEGLQSTGSRHHKDPKKVFEGLDGLSLQAALGHAEQVRTMLRARQDAKGAAPAKGAVPSAEGKDSDGDRTPLHWAAARGYLNVAKLLVQHDEQLKTALDASGRTPAQLACEAEQTDMFHFLEFGTPLTDTKQVFEGLVGASLMAALNDAMQLKQMLGRANGERIVSLRDADEDRYPLHWAAARGHLRCLKLLVEAGADLAALDRDKKTASALAVEMNQRAAVDALGRVQENRGPERGSASAAIAAAAASERAPSSSEDLTA